MRVQFANRIEAQEGARQDVFRIERSSSDELTLTVAFELPARQFGDNKAASGKQRDTLTAFFWGCDLLPENCYWQQASLVMAFRTLAWAVAETMEDGFFAANRIDLAPLIAAYISRDPYLRTVARGWSLGRWQGASINESTAPLFLVSSPFYRELFDFAFAATSDLHAIGSEPHE